MKTLYFDCGMGAAGDMLMASLYEICPDKAGFLKTMNAMGLPGLSVEAEPAVKCGITGTHMKVTIHGEEEESGMTMIITNIATTTTKRRGTITTMRLRSITMRWPLIWRTILTYMHTTMITSPIMTTMMGTTSITLIPTRKSTQKSIPATHTIITQAWPGFLILLNI